MLQEALEGVKAGLAQQTQQRAALSFHPDHPMMNIVGPVR
jgi:hypothetical protein